MRQAIFYSLLLGLVPLLACGHRNVSGSNTATSILTNGDGADSEAIVLPEDQDNSQSPDPTSQRVDLDLVAGELPSAKTNTAPHPLVDLSSAEIEKLLLENPDKLGSASLGRPNSGALYGGAEMEKRSEWKVVNTAETFGTQETIDFLSHTILKVNELFPGTPSIHIGDISSKKGGHLTPHVSHQSGRDVDIGFYYKDITRWYATANEKNLDMARTWAFIKITVTETDIQAIFIDRKLQRILRSYAESVGENKEWLDTVFGGPTTNLRPILLHEPGHQTHLHLRYYSPIAQETGRRVYRALLKHKKIKPPTYYVKYKVKRGDTLNKIARKMKTSVATIKKTNRLRSNRIYANRTYKIPRKGGVSVPRKLILPARRLPTASGTAQTASTAPAGVSGSSK